MKGFAYYLDHEAATDAARLFSCGSPGKPSIVAVFDDTDKETGTPRYGIRAEGLFHPDVVSVWAGGNEMELDRESVAGMVRS